MRTLILAMLLVCIAPVTVIADDDCPVVMCFDSGTTCLGMWPAKGPQATLSASLVKLPWFSGTDCWVASSDTETAEVRCAHKRGVLVLACDGSDVGLESVEISTPWAEVVAP